MGQGCPRTPCSPRQLGMGQRALWAPPALPPLPPPPCGGWEGTGGQELLWRLLPLGLSWGGDGGAGWVFPVFLQDCALSQQGRARCWCYPTPCSSSPWAGKSRSRSPWASSPSHDLDSGKQSASSQETQQPPPLSSSVVSCRQGLGCSGIHRDSLRHPMTQLSIIPTGAGNDRRGGSRVRTRGMLWPGAGYQHGGCSELGASCCGTTARLRWLCGSREKPRCLSSSSPLADVSCFPAPGAAAAPHWSMPLISSSPHPWRGDGAGGSRGGRINISAGSGKSWGYFGAGIYGLLGIRNESVLGRGDPLIQAEGAQMSKGKWRRL